MSMQGRNRTVQLIERGLLCFLPILQWLAGWEEDNGLRRGIGVEGDDRRLGSVRVVSGIPSGGAAMRREEVVADAGDVAA